MVLAARISGRAVPEHKVCRILAEKLARLFNLLALVCLEPPDMSRFTCFANPTDSLTSGMEFIHVLRKSAPDQRSHVWPLGSRVHWPPGHFNILATVRHDLS